MGGIPISPKYGVNPSCTICFFCGETTGIALLGRLKGDVEAPRYVLADYEPCDKCKERFEQGSLLLEVDTYPHISGQPAIQQEENQKLYPTGRYKVLKKEVCERVFGQAHKTALIDVQTYNLLFSELDNEIDTKELTEEDKAFDSCADKNEEYASARMNDNSEDIVITKKGDNGESGEIQNN